MGSLSISELGLSSDDFVVLDTETTGLDSKAEAVQIGICDFYGNKLFLENLRPVNPVSEEVSKIHGIRNEDLENCRTIRFYWDFICGRFINGRVVVGYNVLYDLRILMQSASVHDPLLTNTRSFSPLMVLDVMQLSKRALRLDKYISLHNLSDLLGATAPETETSFHDALFDARMTAACLRELITI